MVGSGPKMFLTSSEISSLSTSSDGTISSCSEFSDIIGCSTLEYDAAPLRLRPSGLGLLVSLAKKSVFDLLYNEIATLGLRLSRSLEHTAL